jgi:hypothetical protein
VIFVTAEEKSKDKDDDDEEEDEEDEDKETETKDVSAQVALSIILLQKLTHYKNFVYAIVGLLPSKLRLWHKHEFFFYPAFRI